MKITTTTSYALVDDQGREFPTEWRACDWIDPVPVEDEDGTVTVRYAIPFDDVGEYEWQDGVEFLLFTNGAERDDWVEDNLDTCKCGWPMHGHIDATRDEANDNGFDPPCEEETTKLEWTDRMFWVERYEHGLVRYALMGESSAVDRRWDVAGGVAVLTVPDDVTDPEAFARAVLEEYSDWCNGDVYGVVEQVYQPAGFDEEDGWVSVSTEACWGFIGTDHAAAHAFMRCHAESDDPREDDLHWVDDDSENGWSYR